LDGLNFTQKLVGIHGLSYLKLHPSRLLLLLLLLLLLFCSYLDMQPQCLANSIPYFSPSSPQNTSQKFHIILLDVECISIHSSLIEASIRYTTNTKINFSSDQAVGVTNEGMRQRNQGNMAPSINYACNLQLL
jgi:hypothetical protein